MAKAAKKAVAPKAVPKAPIRQRLALAVWDWVQGKIDELKGLDYSMGGLKDMPGISITPSFVVCLLSNLVGEDAVVTKVKVGEKRSENVTVKGAAEILNWLSSTAPDGEIAPYVKLIRSLPPDTVLGQK